MPVDSQVETCCSVCRKQFHIMKRCTRCKNVFYCSRECQASDWPQHQTVCSTGTSRDSKPVSPFRTNDNSIFADSDEDTEKDKPIVKGNRKVAGTPTQPSHPPLVDFNKALSGRNSGASAQSSTEAGPTGRVYLHNNEYKTDIPEIDRSKPVCEIHVKYKVKHKISVQCDWPGEAVYKCLAHELKIPLEKLKVIHKGKVLTRETIAGTLQNKALYQVIGEAAENEEGLDQRDISLMMKQAGLDRNKAIQQLRKTGDVIDALLNT